MSPPHKRSCNNVLLLIVFKLQRQLTLNLPLALGSSCYNCTFESNSEILKEDFFCFFVGGSLMAYVFEK